MIILTWMTFATTGWSVAKTQGSHRSLMVLVYATSFIVWGAGLIWALSVADMGAERPTGAYPIWLAVLSLILDCASILFGGGLFMTAKAP
jgi:hypothetical protein